MDLKKNLEDQIVIGYARRDKNHKPIVVPVSSDIQEIVIKQEALDTSQLAEGEGSNEYLPKTWDEYVGQDIAKERVADLIKGSIDNKEVLQHIFLSGPPGHGKTLFAEILAHQLGKKLVTTTGGQMKTEQDFVDKVVECDGGIIFIDEANRISKRAGFFMLPIMERFKYEGRRLKKFTILLASTHKGDLAKDLDALLQRCISIDLESYTEEQMIIILRQFNKHQYPNFKVSDDILKRIAENSRQTPRIGRILLREYVYTKNFTKVLRNNNIVANGITKTDLKVLNYLRQYDGAGKESIAKFLRVKGSTYESEIEPYLIFQELVHISGKRKITEKGKELLLKIGE